MEFKQITDETVLTEQEERARRRVCLALDSGEPMADTLRAKELSDYVGMVKVGGTLFNAAARERTRIVNTITTNTGMNVFLDQKKHDTPAQVRGYVREGCEEGVYMMTIHIAGGEAMCKAALQGAQDGAEKYGVAVPKIIGVTVLTSLNDSDLLAQGIDIGYDSLVKWRAGSAREWGLDGIVCPASKAGAMEEEFGVGWLKVTPGVKFSDVQNVGQKQLYTPDMAVQDCKNSILVIGSAITKAGNVYGEGTRNLLQAGTPQNRQQAAYNILQVMAPHV